MKFHSFLTEKIPPDGSCFFQAISKALEKTNPISKEKLREIVSREIKQSDKYQKMLGDIDIENYCKWILKPDSWGGEPEIIILSDYFNLNIIVGIVETKEILFFGKENQNIIFLIFYGNHYDLGSVKFEIFPNTFLISYLIRKISDFSDVEYLVEEFRNYIYGLNKKNEFVDVKNYKIFCTECGSMFKLVEEFEKHKVKFNHMKCSSIENI